MTRPRWSYVGLVVLVWGYCLLTGCAVCRPDCRGMDREDCRALVNSCNQVNSDQRMIADSEKTYQKVLEKAEAQRQQEVPWSYGAGKLPSEGHQ